jgi:hypothetical protein
MTKEERDKKVAERRARMEGSPDIGGVTLPFSRATLLRFFWGFALIFPAWTMWNARGNLTFETVFAGSVLYVACLLPSWFWATGRIQGLPIFPIFGLGFLPTYVTPLWQGHSALVQYTANEINTAAWTVTGFLLIGMLFWQQMAVRAIGVPQAVRMINLKKAEKVLMVCLIAEVLFELLALFFWQLGGGAFAAIRGFATAAGRMGIFVFSYQMGMGNLKPAVRSLFLLLVSLLVVQETASLILATVLPTLGLAFAGYILGSGKIPLKTLTCATIAVMVLHAGKYEMRAIYLEKRERSTGIMDYPRYFTEWVGYGMQNLGMGKAGEEKKEDISTAQERGSLIQLLIRIQKATPSQIPYLEGASYRFIPELLIPRIMHKEKIVAHMGNWILSVQYGLLQAEELGKTSVAFDPIMEAYANYGIIGVLVFAIVFGFFMGWVTRLTIHVPMLSFGFLFGVQVIAAVVASWNTAGVFVTTAWQSFLALCGLSLFLMSKQDNPVWKYYALKLAEKLKFKKDPKLEKTLGEVNEILKTEDQSEDKGYGISDIEREKGKAESGPTSLQTSPTREELRRVEKETAPVINERPTRFVYGAKKNY